MNKVEGVILEGEKLGIERKQNKEGKTIISLHLLNGFESVKLGVKDNELLKKLEELPNRKSIRVKAEIGLFNGNLYVAAKGIVS